MRPLKLELEGFTSFRQHTCLDLSELDLFAITGPTAEAIGHDATLIWAGALGGSVTLAFMFVQGARGPERDGSLATAEPSAEAA